MTIKEIEIEMNKIIDNYKHTLYPEWYICDNAYMKLLESHKLLVENDKKQHIPKEVDPYRMNKQRFNELPEDIRKLLLEANYNYQRDPDDILNFYPLL